MASRDPRIGTQLAEYLIEGLLGRGGMGMVYLAEHIHLGKKVAVKVLPPEYARDAAFRKRFEREARLAASLEHPNIVPVTDAGEADGERPPPAAAGSLPAAPTGGRCSCGSWPGRPRPWSFCSSWC